MPQGLKPSSVAPKYQFDLAGKKGQLKQNTNNSASALQSILPQPLMQLPFCKEEKSQPLIELPAHSPASPYKFMVCCPWAAAGPICMRETVNVTPKHSQWYSPKANKA